jgi:hypothetical protein
VGGAARELRLGAEAGRSVPPALPVARPPRVPRPHPLTLPPCPAPSRPTPTRSITWGLAAVRPCPALANANVIVPPSDSPSRARAAGGGASASGGAPSPTAAPAGGAPSSSSYGPNKASPVTPMAVDNPSRKPLYAICATASVARPAKGDILSMDLSPKEDGQPVIMVTLAHNGSLLLRAALPCASIAALQMYPFITALPGTVVSLHEALTPSPLFTWFSPTSATADIQMADLDTCVKYNTTAAAAAGGVSEFHGSTTFTGGRHRWTVQLDNMGAAPGHIFVGLVTSEGSQAPSSSVLAATLPQALAGRALGAAQQQQPGGSPAAAQAPGAIAAAVTAAAGTSPAAAAAAATATAAGAGPISCAAAPPPGTPGAAAPEPPRGKWGVWVKLPGHNASAPSAAPPLDGCVQCVESTSNHCCITVDLDLIGGYAKFFRNGHLLGSALTGLTAPISPAMGFLQGPSQHLQAGLVNITKLRQLDLEWNGEACSGDLRILGRSVQKVSEVFGDYSTVLATKGFISGVHLWLVKVNHLSEPDSIFIGVCRGCMPLDQDPQDLRDRTYYLSNGVIRVGGRRVATTTANFTKGDIVGVVLDADQVGGRRGGGGEGGGREGGGGAGARATPRGTRRRGSGPASALPGASSNPLTVRPRLRRVRSCSCVMALSRGAPAAFAGGSIPLCRWTASWTRSPCWVSAPRPASCRAGLRQPVGWGRRCARAVRGSGSSGGDCSLPHPPLSPPPLLCPRLGPSPRPPQAPTRCRSTAHRARSPTWSGTPSGAAPTSSCPPTA